MVWEVLNLTPEEITARAIAIATNVHSFFPEGMRAEQHANIIRRTLGIPFPEFQRHINVLQTIASMRLPLHEILENWPF